MTCIIHMRDWCIYSIRDAVCNRLYIIGLMREAIIIDLLELNGVTNFVSIKIYSFFKNGG